MFQLPLDNIIVILLLVIILSILISHIFSELFRIKKKNKILKNYIICRICDHIFSDFSSNDLLKCPKCGSKNERDKIIEL